MGAYRVLKIAAVGVALLLAPGVSEAVSVSQAYLFSTFSTVPGAPVSPPFAFSGTDGVTLTLDGTGTATGTGAFVPPINTSITASVTFTSNTGVINPGELGANVNSEVQRLDDLGVINEGPDAPLNTDYTTGAAVIFQLATPGLRNLLIGEDAGLDPMRIESCSDAVCTAPQVLFNGFDAPTLASILARPDFDAGDSGAVDQAYLFVFDAPLEGWLRITEIANPGGEPLELDFVGGQAVPEPTTLLFFGTNLAALGALAWRRMHRVAI